MKGKKVDPDKIVKGITIATTILTTIGGLINTLSQMKDNK